MTLFRKIYKQANDDIKPSEDMINRVILNAHKGADKRQSPLPYRRYAKYAVSAAAAVVVVSAAVISMPYWQKTRDDGVIIEEQVSTPTPSDMSESVVSIQRILHIRILSIVPKLFKIPILPLLITIRIVKLKRRKRTVTIRVVTMKKLR